MFFGDPHEPIEWREWLLGDRQCIVAQAFTVSERVVGNKAQLQQQLPQQLLLQPISSWGAHHPNHKRQTIHSESKMETEMLAEDSQDKIQEEAIPVENDGDNEKMQLR